VAYSHCIGIILRDIKPRNVMLDTSGSGLVKLTGFALGRFASLPAEPLTRELAGFAHGRFASLPAEPLTRELAGFALGRFASLPAEPLTREVVTLSYRAPEILLGGVNPIYSAPVDIWSVGCTFAEIASGRTLFEGDSEIGQVFKIFRLLGTPDESSWPDIRHMPDFLPHLPQWRPLDLAWKVSGLDRAGVDLLGAMLRYDPATRVSARAALQHPYFTPAQPPRAHAAPPALHAHAGAHLDGAGDSGDTGDSGAETGPCRGAEGHGGQGAGGGEEGAGGGRIRPG
ncbi:kinase-like domain-containing protein, partial [Baffinella frigidus]